MDKWVKRATTFLGVVNTLGGQVKTSLERLPPLSMAECSVLSSQLRLGIPPSIVEFLVSAASCFNFQYVWTPDEKKVQKLQAVFPHYDYIYGGVDLCDVRKFGDYQQVCGFDWAFDLVGAERDMWVNSAPFAAISCGDYLGVYLSSKDHPVVYLNHEGDSCLLSCSFEQFLCDWEQLFYIGPDVWLLSPFRDKRTGFLNPNLPLRDELARLFA